jgi:hypothetical protein
MRKETRISAALHIPRAVATCQARYWHIISTVCNCLPGAQLPKHIDEQLVLSAISVEKDVDGFHPLNMGRLCMKVSQQQHTHSNRS